MGSLVAKAIYKMFFSTKAWPFRRNRARSSGAAETFFEELKPSIFAGTNLSQRSCDCGGPRFKLATGLRMCKPAKGLGKGMGQISVKLILAAT